MNLLIVGSIATDSVKTPSGEVRRALGGTATYASVAASYFSTTGIVGVVGRDFDRKHTNLLKRRGVDLTGMQVDPTGDTFHWAGAYEGDMNEAKTLATHLNVFESFKPVIPPAYRQTPFVMLGNIQPELQLEVLAQVKKPSLVLCDTMNFWISSVPEQLEKVFRKVDVICINDGEACQFCGTSSLPVAAKRLLKLGPRRVIIKRGSHGVSLFGRDSFFSLPAIPLEKVKDPTGAGDSFAGGFIGYLARGGKLNENAFRRALVAGTIMASYCVEDFSCRRTTRLTPEDINKRAAILKESSRVPSFKVS